ncbi:MAG: hypothetical protein COA73_11080 [Candidatus Hydrogenedentota bacterium]|nr:MAG: hypothetical protein COA73_11080 [Candidatus Hydrogenedentota bacterium]
MIFPMGAMWACMVEIVRKYKIVHIFLDNIVKSDMQRKCNLFFPKTLCDFSLCDWFVGIEYAL